MKIVETNSQIKKIVEQELNDHFMECWRKAAPQIEVRIRDRMIAAIKAEPEYDALLRGRLHGEFGLTDAASKLSAILNTWAKSIRSSNTGKKFTIEAINYKFSDVLGLPDAEQLTNKGQSLAWLDWLLTQGDRTIIREYEVSFNPSARSRSGQAVMVERKRAKWGVPGQYAGTITNNWVSRAIDNISENDIEDIVFGEIEKQW